MNGKITCLILISIMTIVVMMPTVAATRVDDVSKLEGKRATWKINSDLNGDDECEISISEIHVTGTVENITVDNISCTITFKNYTSSAEYEITGSLPEWENIPIIVIDYTPLTDYPVGIYTGVARKMFNASILIGAENLTAEYDKETGLLLGIYNHTVNDGDQYYLILESTNVFFNATEASPVLLIIFVAIASFTGVYIAGVTIRDKKVRSKEACFGDECWENTS